MRYIFPILMLGVAVAIFFAYTDPTYKDIKMYRAQVASYDSALDNADKLERTKQEIIADYGTIPPEDIEKLSKLLPDNVDNIRLILEIESVAAKYGMTIKNVKFDVQKQQKLQNGERIVEQNAQDTELGSKEYGLFDLSFSTQGTYQNFVAFSKEIERSLRIVDIKSVSFSSPEASPIQSFNQPKNIYQYDVDVRTYWLKN